MTTNEPPPSSGEPQTPTSDLPSYGSVQPPMPPAGSVPPPPIGAPPPAPGGYGGPPVPEQNKKALWSMILGIVSVVGLCCTFGGLIGIASIILGITARGEIEKSNGAQTGTGMAIAGIATGAVGILVFIVIVVLVATGAIDTSFTVDS